MKFLKIMALSYLVKTILLGIAWLFVPDLPQRATALARSAWSYVAPAPAAAEALPAAVPQAKP
jgi:hypothetical protein